MTHDEALQICGSDAARAAELCDELNVAAADDDLRWAAKVISLERKLMKANARVQELKRAEEK